MKKSGEVTVIIASATACVIGYVFLFKKNKKFISENVLTIENYVNRLREYDLSPEKEASSLFYDLLECGYSPKRAFSTVQKEVDEAGDFF